MIGFTQLWRKLSVIFRTGSRSSSTMAQSPPLRDHPHAGPAILTDLRDVVSARVRQEYVFDYVDYSFSRGQSHLAPSLGRPRDCRGGHAKLPGRVGKGLDEFRTLAFSTTHLRHPSREAAEPLDCVAKPRWPTVLGQAGRPLALAEEAWSFPVDTSSRRRVRFARVRPSSTPPAVGRFHVALSQPIPAVWTHLASRLTLRELSW